MSRPESYKSLANILLEYVSWIKPSINNLAIHQLISDIWNICSQNGVWWLNTATTNANLKMLPWLDSPLLQVADEVVHGDLWHEDEVAQPHRGVERHDDGLNALTGLSLNNPPNCHHGSSLCKGVRADRPGCGPTCTEVEREVAASWAPHRQGERSLTTLLQVRAARLL